MVTTEEKLSLMREVGALRAADKLAFEIAQKKALAEMTDLKFERITFPEIKKALTKWCWQRPIDGRGVFGFGLVFCVISLFVSFLIASWGGRTVEDEWLSKFLLFVGISFGCIAMSKFLTCFRPCQVRTLGLYSWADNLPYGALLAVKEAQEKGLCNFEIYYPAKAEKRIKEDPIIVGYKAKIMFKVFHWDDGKIYE